MTRTGKDAKKVVHIKNVLRKVLTRYPSQAGGDLTQIWELWDRAVGPVIAANTRPAAFKGKLLLVHAASSTWLHQLQFLKKEMIAKLNHALGKTLIDDLNFKIGPVGKDN